MFDTYVTVIGTVLTRPEWRRTTKTGAVVANFRVASHPRRYDRENEAWVDAPSLRVRVNCWRRLAEGVCASIMVGDPVVVYGRIATRDWKTEQGEPRISYEVEAVAVGHDLSRGQGSFERKRLDTIATVIEDEAADTRVNGEATQSLAALNATRLGEPEAAALREGEEAFDDFADPDGFGLSGTGSSDAEALAILRSAGLDPNDGEEDIDGREGPDDEDTDSGEVTGEAAGSGGSGGRRRRGSRAPVPA